MTKKSWRKYLKTRQAADRLYYNSIRNYYNRALTHEKRAYFSSQIRTCQDNTKLLWKNFHRWGVRTPTLPNFLPAHLQDPDLINNHFISSVLSSNVSHNSSYSSNSPKDLPNPEFRLSLPDIQDVCAHILKLKPGITGPDDISAKMLQLSLSFIAAPLTHIINVSFERGTVPQQWKQSLTFPILKKSADRSQVSLEDLRPISILPVCLKAAESIFYSQLSEYIETCNILPSVQSGFRKGYSATSSLCNLLDSVTSSIDSGHLTYLALLDLSKAFDSVDLTILVERLFECGVRGACLEWMSSYLNGRQQFTQILSSQGPVRSELKLITSGVPQGSVLGPLLFSLYLADLPNCLNHCSVHLFADDIQIYLSFPLCEISIAGSKINADLNGIVQWCSLNSLSLNPCKCQSILLGPRHARQQVDSVGVHILGTPIPLKDSIKNLGVVMDKDLTFSQNVSQLCQRAFFSLKQLLPFKFTLDSQTKLLLCDSLVLSILNYGDIVYGPYLSVADKRRLQKIQNLCIRFVTHVPPCSHVTPYLRSFNCLKLQERRFIHYTAFLNKIVQSGRPCYLSDKLCKRSASHNLNLRHVNLTFSIPSHSTSFFKHCFSYLSVYLYNNLLSKLPESSNASLKKTLRNGVLTESLSIDINVF